MKEIKFRCWNAFSGVMQSWEDMVSMNKIHLLANQKKEYPVMQFTGLKDKSGVEIYEGDIVILNDNFHSCVEFVDCGFYVKTNSVYSVSSHDWDLICSWQDISVIGNIYENPELISE